MRNAVLCVATMLAMLLLWPTIFHGDATLASAAQPEPVRLASLSDGSSRVSIAVPPSTPLACQRRFSTSIEHCRGGKRCIAAAQTRPDLCRATGNWPE